MPGIERLTIALPTQMAAELRQVVEAGEYASTSEAIRDALRTWKLKRSERQAAIEELRRLWDEGIESGPGRGLSLEEIKAEGRRRLQEMQSQAADPHEV
jgi:antitoxin ParD1/3/4